MRNTLSVLAVLAALCFGSAHANRLNVYVQVLDCNGNPMPNIPVTLSNSTDCPVTVNTANATTSTATGVPVGVGTAAFVGGKADCISNAATSGSIEFCSGAAENYTVIQALINGQMVPVPAETLRYPSTNTPATPQQYVYTVDSSFYNTTANKFQCTYPAAEFDYTTNPAVPGAPIIIRQPQSQCSSPPPSPSPSPSPSPPPFPSYNAAGETCIAFFPDLFTPTAPTKVTSTNYLNFNVLSASFTDKQKNDDANGVILNSGTYAKTQAALASPLNLFGRILKSQRWGWETRWVIPTSGSLSRTGTMYCGQSNAAGLVSVTVNSNGSIDYYITMSQNNISDGDLHIGAYCASPNRDNVPFGNLNCNPGNEDPGCTNSLSSLPQTKSAGGTITLSPACTGIIDTIIHIGF